MKKNQLNKKAQVAIEFVATIAAAFFFLSLFLLTLYNSNEEKFYQKQQIQLKEIVLSVQNEINLASESANGYYREFSIPKTSGGMEYDITIDSGVIYAKTKNEKHALTVYVPKVTGNLNFTKNIIKKESGEIFLNQ